MSARYIKNINTELNKLIVGEVCSPIKIKGIGDKRLLLINLETLRRNIVVSMDTIAEQDKKNKTSVASVVHDLKTPLAVISGYAESLSDGMNDKDYAKLIVDKIAQMNEMVQTLVDTSRQELSKSMENRERIAAPSFFIPELKKYEGLATAKQITLKRNKVPDVYLRICVSEIGRVIQNIVSNAIKYTKAGGKVTVSYKINNGYLSIRIRDNGEGVEKDSLPLIFDKFYREDKARTTANSGLGLYIAKEIVEAHGGTISAKSKKGKGSTFIVNLPLEPKLESPNTFPRKIDRLPYPIKLIVVFFGGFIVSPMYRILKYRETNYVSTLVSGLLGIPLFVLLWIIDIMSVFLSNKISFIAN